MIEIKNCTFKDCGRAIVCDSDLEISVSNCEVKNNNIKKQKIESSGDTLVLIGNGINYSLKDFLGLSIDTSRFFEWEFTEFDGMKLSIENKFPLLYKKLKEYSNCSDNFEKIEKIIADAKECINKNINCFENGILLCEIEHYLMIVFSNYQKIINTKDISEWNWLKYFKNNKSKIKLIVSLNYDLVVEKILKDLRIEYYRLGVQNESGEIPIFKPHGSIDYGVRDINVKINYPLKSVISRNNTPISSLQDSELLMPRVEVDIVPPTQYSEVKNFQWVKCGYELLNDYGKEIKKFIICGVSYWDCDREEIDRIINNINPNCEVININPNKTGNSIKEFGEKIIRKVGKKRYKQIDDIAKLL